MPSQLPKSMPMAENADIVLEKNEYSNGNMSAQPDTLNDRPPIITAQKMSFCPALNLPAGGCSPFLKIPPPLRIQLMSPRLGRL